MTCNGMLAKTFHFSVSRLSQMTSTEFWWGDLRSHQPLMAVSNPVAKPIRKYANTSALPVPSSVNKLQRINCKDRFVPILCCTQESQTGMLLCCPCQQCTYLAVRPDCGWRAGFGTVLSLPYKVQERLVCKIMVCANYFACKLTVDLWMKSGTKRIKCLFLLNQYLISIDLFYFSSSKNQWYF